MKANHGATFVRIYPPECREISVRDNVVQAWIDNGMGVVGIPLERASRSLRHPRGKY